MVDHGTVRSTVQPDEVVIDDYSVWVHSNITAISENGTDDELGFNGYEFNMVQYTKEEYIHMLSEKNDTLEEAVTITQLALCEVYEMLL